MKALLYVWICGVSPSFLANLKRIEQIEKYERPYSALYLLQEEKAHKGRNILKAILLSLIWPVFLVTGLIGWAGAFAYWIFFGASHHDIY